MEFKLPVIILICLSVFNVGSSEAHFDDDHHLLRGMSLQEEELDHSSPHWEFYQVRKNAKLFSFIVRSRLQQ